MSLWSATVITNLFGAIPVVGDSLAIWLWGGFSVDNPTLNRFFSLHYLLPFLIFGVVILHIWALHVPGNNNPIGISVKVSRIRTLSPYITVKDAFSLSIFLILFSYFIFFAPNVLGHTTITFRPIRWSRRRVSCARMVYAAFLRDLACGT